MRNKILWLLSVICVVGVLFRFAVFYFGPVSLYWDEMAIANDALSVAATGRDMHGLPGSQLIFPSYGDYKMPVYIWAASAVAQVTTNVFTIARLPSLLAGLSLLPAVWWLARGLESSISREREQKPSLFSWVATAVASVLPWAIHFSSVGFEGHMGMVFFTWSLAFWFASWRPKGWRHWVLLALTLLFGIAAAYTYFSVRYVWLGVFLLSAFLPTFAWKKQWWKWLLVAGLWALALVPLSRAGFYSESMRFRLSASSVLQSETRPIEVNVWRQRAGNQVWSRVLYNQFTFMGRDLAVNMAEHFSPPYLFFSGDPNLRHGTGDVGILLPIMAPFLAIGVFALLKQSPRVGIFVTLWWALALVPASVPINVPHALRSLNALPAVAILVAYGVFAFGGWLQSWKTWGRVVVWSGIGALLVWQVTSHLAYSAMLYPRVSADVWQDGYLPLAQYIGENHGRYEQVVVDQFDDRFFLYYQPESGMSWSEIQNIPSLDFKRTKIGNVRFETINNWESLPSRSLIITTKDRLPIGILAKDTIRGKGAHAQFVAVVTP